MVWKAKEVINLKNGDTRRIMHFAYLPIQIDDDILWLGYYETLELWVVIVKIVMLEGKQLEFTYGNWEVISKRIVNGVN